MSVKSNLWYGIGFASLCTVIGPEKLLNLLNLSDAKLKSMTTWPVFPCFQL